MTLRARSLQPRRCVISCLCLLVFLFSLQAKLELYSHGQAAHPCSSSKLRLEAQGKLGVPTTVLARTVISTEYRPTLRSEPVVEEAFFVPVPHQLSLYYQMRLHRSPPES